MREAVERHRPELLRAARRAVGSDPFERLDEGTAFLQPAIFCASLVGHERLGSIAASCFAGHSLGELSALVAAGALERDDGMELVAIRGRLMARAAADEPGAMLAVSLGADAAFDFAARHGVGVANDNSPKQSVLSGPEDAIERARAAARLEGLKAHRLPIRGAFHSQGMASVVPEWRAALREVRIGTPVADVYSSVTADVFDDVRGRLADSLTSRVRWRETVMTLAARGVERFVEVGPGRILTRLVEATLPGADAEAPLELEAARG